MKLIRQNIINGDCLEEMRKMESNSISCIVTDPPYGLGFMGKDWDAGLPHHDIWKEALRIVKPGGHLLAFGGTRTYHRLTCAIEDSGWEIRDCLMWIYGSGFPKSHNHFGIEGYGTALKPAHEPIILAMKKCDGTFKANAEKWGQAGINIDGCRVGTDEMKVTKSNGAILSENRAMEAPNTGRIDCGTKIGRWPANVLFDEEAGKLLDEQSGMSKSKCVAIQRPRGVLQMHGENSRPCHGKDLVSKIEGVNDSGGASRFFYCAKASSSERNEGCEALQDKIGGGLCATVSGDSRTGNITIQKNNHPTVKPLRLMQYLIKLVIPPKDGVLLDPFCGSGSTILAAHNIGVKAIGIEKNAEYCEIAQARIRNNLPLLTQS